MISRLETQQVTATTHSLESRGQASSAGLKHSKVQQPLTFWRAGDRHHQQASNTARHSSHSPPGQQGTGIISRIQTQQGTATSHSPSGEQRTGIISKLQTQQGNSSHSQPGQQRIGIISRFQTYQSTIATHHLESIGQASSADLKYSQEQQPLTPCREEDMHHQQA